jgi:prolyl oligopeptidase
MKDQGHDVLYFGNIEGGHSGAADNQQAGYMAALGYTFLIKELWTGSGVRQDWGQNLYIVVM